MASPKSEKLVLRCTSTVSLNDRFSLMLKVEPDMVDVTCDTSLLQCESSPSNQSNQSSQSNRILALQMESRASVQAALQSTSLNQRLGRASVRARLGWAPGPSMPGKARDRVFFLGGMRRLARGSLHTLGARAPTSRGHFPNSSQYCGSNLAVHNGASRWATTLGLNTGVRARCVCGVGPAALHGRLGMHRAGGTRGALTHHGVRKMAPPVATGLRGDRLHFTRPPGGGAKGGLAGRGQGIRTSMKVAEALPTKEELDNQLDEYMSMSKSQLDAQLDEYMSMTCRSDSFTLD